jgi:lactoylglutathione lyase
MRYLHTMIRVGNLEKSLHFYIEGMGLELLSRQDYPKDRFTLVFLKAPDDGTGKTEKVGAIELTFNWDTPRYERGNGYGHVAFEVDSIDAFRARLIKAGYDLSWGPGETPNRSRRMAFVDDPDGYEIEILEGHQTVRR